jgi:hypothetical protein
MHGNNTIIILTDEVKVFIEMFSFWVTKLAEKGMDISPLFVGFYEGKQCRKKWHWN